MKKIIAREFIWLVVNLVLAAPLAILFINSMELVSEEDFFTENEKNFIAELFLLAYLFCFLGLYLVRFLVLAIQTLSTPEKK